MTIDPSEIEQTLGLRARSRNTSESLGFKDPTGQTPKPEYMGLPNTNTRVRAGGEFVDLPGTNDFSVINQGAYGEYPHVQHYETTAGHKIEYNNTPGNERILIKHPSGSSFLIGPDGGIIIRSEKRIDCITGDYQFVAKNGQLTYDGDLTLNVTGDLNINVGGEFKVQSKDYNQNVIGEHKTEVTGDKSEVINGNVSLQTTGTNTQFSMSGYYNINKGGAQYITDGEVVFSNSGGLQISAPDFVNISSNDINIAGKSLSVFGNTGTIGGENIIMYNYNMFTGHSITAGDTVKTESVIANKTVSAASITASATINTDTLNSSYISATEVDADTFVGDLDGTAKLSGGTGVYVKGATATAASSVTAQAEDTNSTALPTENLLNNYLSAGSFGIKRIKIDEGNVIKNNINLSERNGGVSSYDLDVSETRRRLRDTNHQNNSDFIAYQTSNGNIHPDYNRSVPSTIGRVRNPTNFYLSGSNPIGFRGGRTFEDNGAVSYKQIISVSRQPNSYTPDLVAVESIKSGVSAQSLLIGQVRMNQFLEFPLRRYELGEEEQNQLFRNLAPQATIYHNFNLDNTIFRGYELKVVEGVYKPEENENYNETGPLGLSNKGRYIVYEVHGDNGLDLDKTFDAAVWIANNTYYEKLILDYDAIEGEHKLNAQIIIQTPEVSEDFQATFDNKVQTLYNNNLIGENELIEIGRQESDVRFSDGQVRTYNGQNGRLDPSTLTSVGGNHKLRSDAATAYLQMVEAARRENIIWGITDSYRTYETQVRLAREKGLYSQGGLAATPGTSRHGWGLAVDLNNAAATPRGLSAGSAQFRWLQSNAARYGFYTISREPWHWEYRG